MKKIFALLALAAVAQAAAAADIVGDAKNAKGKIEMCIGCHAIAGYKATFPEVFQVPMLGGQNAKYIENALKGYQKGERKHPTMKGIAVSLSDQDIADIAAFYSQQK
ncbi:cytochrome c [Pseudoduganella eburnea]|jgi:cytochrome c553|uniref:Cytochrome c n=1 Tax=Massilia eburnea TaxID=1776165 RepID=A0A6L6QDL3_9BURK|nr:cytochrome c [Massilia eburnea]MTW10259.1 cytochrome c [Massilia eburnea]